MFDTHAPTRSPSGERRAQHRCGGAPHSHRADATQRDPLRRGCVHQRARLPSRHRGARGDHPGSDRSHDAVDRRHRATLVLGAGRRGARSMRASPTSNIRSPIAQATMEHVRKLATARAVIMYKNADVGLTSMFGDNALDSARRAHLVDDANAAATPRSRSLTAAVDDLNAQQRSLESQRSQQQKILGEVANERHHARRPTRRASGSSPARSSGRAGRPATTAAARADVRAFTAAATANALATPTGPPSSGEPLRVDCVRPRRRRSCQPAPQRSVPRVHRARESNGQYDVVSPSGYYGVYQFLPSTWDTTAVHVGRLDLVGVLPSRASQFDQDEVAWAPVPVAGQGPVGRSLLTRSPSRASTSLSVMSASDGNRRSACDRSRPSGDLVRNRDAPQSRGLRRRHAVR